MAPAAAHGPGSLPGSFSTAMVEGRLGLGAAQLPQLGDQLCQRLGAGQVDREQPVPAGGAPQRTPVRPACRHPDRDPRLLERARLEAAVPVGGELGQAPVEQPGTLARIALLAELGRVELARALAAEAHAEHETPAAQAVERHGLARELMRPPASQRRDHRPEHQALGGHRHRGQRDPRISDPLDRRAVLEVVPDEEAVPAPRLGPGGQLGHHARLGELLEGREVDAAVDGQGGDK